MNHKEILEKAVAQAITNGWNTLDVTDWWDVYQMNRGSLAVEFRPAQNAMGQFFEWPAVIFEHGFAKAIWGSEPDAMPFDQIHYGADVGRFGTGAATEARVTLQAWQYHLQQMVIADDPIAYLGDNLA